MSIPIVKQTVSGPPLPVGTNIAYARDIATHQWKQFQCTSDGYITYHDLYPFPPYENLGDLQQFGPLTIRDNLNTYSNVYDVTSLSAAPFDGLHLNKMRFGFMCRSLHYNTDYFMRSFVKTNESLDGYSGHYMITEKVYPLGVFSLFENAFIAGLGCMLPGSPYFYLHIGSYSLLSDIYVIPVQPSGCIVNSQNEVLSFGATAVLQKWTGDRLHELKGSIYVLLNNETGVAFEFQLPNRTSRYISFIIPAGGKIKQFADGFYIASNSAGEHFLYSINNNGTLIDQLDIGTCNIDNPLEILAVA